MSERRREEVVRKYGATAPTYSQRYAAPDAVARWFVRLVAAWGPRVGAGASVLELGCANGFMTEALVRGGYRVTAVDLVPEMIDEASRRLADAGLEAELVVADVNTFEPARRYDVVLGAMWTFFHYVEDPRRVLTRFAPGVATKIIVDVNPRVRPVVDAMADVRAAGFGSVRSRPVAVPQGVRFPPSVLSVLGAALRTPMLGDAVLRRRFNVAILGAR